MTVPKEIPEESSEVLRKEILDQSEAEASEILKQAYIEAERIIQKAEQEAGRTRESIIKKAEMQAEGVRRKILSGVSMEIQQETLRARDDLLNDIFAAVLKKLEGLRNTKSYIPYVKQFVLEGVSSLGGPSVTIIPGSTEKEILTTSMLAEIEKEANERTDVHVRLNISKETVDEGGVILVSEDGRIRFDNRFSSRMERFKRRMRLEANHRILE